MTTEPLEIVRQPTPNPNAAKFTLNRMISTKGTTYRDAAATDVEWARSLLQIEGVSQVFALNDFISIVKSQESDWNAIVPQVERILEAAFV